MAMVDRIRNICLQPAAEWHAIAAEPADTPGLVRTYLAPLAAVSAAASFAGAAVTSVFFPFGGFVSGLAGGLVGAFVSFLATIAGCYVLAYAIDMLAPRFGGRQAYGQAFKTAVYACTPALAAGVLLLVPALGGFAVLLASFYGMYVLYLGLPVTMRSPREQALTYTVAVVVVCVVLGALASTVLGALGLAAVMA
ncbi:MAG: Yip1 family protein [Vicinamibacterales bacterium]